MRYVVACGLVGLLALACSAEQRERIEGAGGTGGSTTAGSGGDAGNAGSTSSGGSSSGGSAGAGATGGDAGASGSAQGGVGGDAGSAGTTSSGGSAGAMGGSAGSGGSNSCTGQCLPPAPSGWSGPVAMYEGTSPPTCVGDFAGTALTAKSDFQVGQSHCACSCDPPQGEACGNANVCQQGNCIQACFGNGDYQLAPNACIAVSTAGTYNYNFAKVPSYSATGCQPKANTTIDASSFRNEVVACDMADPGGTCGGAAVCTPKLGASFQAACVLQSGDVACPAGPYSVKVTTYASFTDDRRCTACTCGNASGTCNAKIDLISGCSGLPIYYDGANAGMCSGAVSGSPRYMRYSVNPQGSCPASAPGTTGDAKPSGAATLCCLPQN